MHVVSVTAGSHHSVVLAADGAVFSFGNGALGRLGLGDDESAASPRRVGTLQGVQAVRDASTYSSWLEVHQRRRAANALAPTSAKPPPDQGQFNSSQRCLGLTWRCTDSTEPRNGSPQAYQRQVSPIQC